jgi:hypothetical protein
MHFLAQNSLFYNYPLVLYWDIYWDDGDNRATPGPDNRGITMQMPLELLQTPGLKLKA